MSESKDKPTWAKDIDVKEKPNKVLKELLLVTVCGNPEKGDELYFLTNTVTESLFHLGLYIEELQQKNIALKCALGKYGRHKDNCNFSSSQPDCNCGYLKAFTDLVIIDKSEFGEEDGDDVTGADWDVVSINGRLKKTPKPMSAITIIRNWLHLKGGTEMKGATPESVLNMLCETILYKNGINYHLK